MHGLSQSGLSLLSLSQSSLSSAWSIIFRSISFLIPWSTVLASKLLVVRGGMLGITSTKFEVKFELELNLDLANRASKLLRILSISREIQSKESSRNITPLPLR